MRPHPLRAAVALAAALLLAPLAAGLGPAVPAVAHGSLFQASPGPGQQVGGTLDFVDLAFLEVVDKASVLVTHNGVEVTGRTTNTTGVIINFVFDQPLVEPGRYEVSYTWTSPDGHEQTEAYQFTYQPQSPPAFHIGQPGGPAGTPGAEGRSWFRMGAFAVLVVALAGLALLFLLQVQSRRAAAGGGDGPAAGDDDDRRGGAGRAGPRPQGRQPSPR